MRPQKLLASEQRAGLDGDTRSPCREAYAPFVGRVSRR